MMLRGRDRMSDSTLKLQRLTDIGTVNLRGDAGSPEFLDAVAKATGLALPLEPNTVASGEHDSYWLGPNEWMLVGEQADMSRVVAVLSVELKQQHAAVSDLSGGQITYRLSGDGARQLLSKGCALDLHPTVFGAGACAQTGLAKASVILRPLGNESGFDVLVRRSFSDYLWQWLLRAGREYRIEVT
jgi:sarcosine oxidase subunit gamma